MRWLVVASAWLASACTATPPEEWSYVYATIIAPSCTTSACHSRLSAAGQLEMDDAGAAYSALTGRSCDDVMAPVTGYVDVANPTSSILSGLLRRSGPTGMPPNGRLATTEIELVEAWMSRGAPCD